MRKIAIIGAGFIAPAHVEALSRRRDAEVAAIVDPSGAAASALAQRAGRARTFSSIDALLAEAKPDAAHVLTPPPLHAKTAAPLLEAGVDVLVEKPLAATSDECRQLIAAAERSGAALGVNHNFMHHPAFARLKRIVRSGRCGKPRRLQMRYAAPLRQLASGQFGHWMFNRPVNLLLEQAVHPLSQIDDLMGGIVDVHARPGPVRRPADGIELATDWLLELSCGAGVAHLDVALGVSFPSWTISVLCDDGVVEADIWESRVSARRPHASIPVIDAARRNLSQGAASFGAAARGLAGFAAELSRLGPPSDGFSRSMAASISAFYDALAEGKRPTGASVLRLVETCEKAAAAASVVAPAVTRTPTADATYDVGVIGGTGFIGRRLVKDLVERGARVAVMARNVANLPAVFHQEGVGVFRGSAGDAAAAEAFCARAEKIVNLAHGGGGSSRDAVVANMVAGAEAIARTASEAGAERLIHISSSAALYLGDADETVTMETPPDPQPDERADYACAKIMSDKAAMQTARIPTIILRPAVVVGEGGTPFHSALGAYENETHCRGWNDGRNPLPFVLVEDVSSAIIIALDAPVDAAAGKAFNLVGDVRWSARQYTEELARATVRPLKFHGSSVRLLYAEEWLKYAVKKVAGRPGVMAPSMRDLRSRGMVATIDASAEKEILGWRPCADEETFRNRAIRVHAETRA